MFPGLFRARSAASLDYCGCDDRGDAGRQPGFCSWLLWRPTAQHLLSGAYFDFPGFSKDNVTELYLFARNVARGIVTDNWSLVPAPFRFTAPQDIYTLGYHMKSKPGALGPWDYGIEAMWQFGDRTAVFPATTVAAAKGAPR